MVVVNVLKMMDFVVVVKVVKLTGLVVVVNEVKMMDLVVVVKVHQMTG